MPLEACNLSEERVRVTRDLILAYLANFPGNRKENEKDVDDALHNFAAESVALNEDTRRIDFLEQKNRDSNYTKRPVLRDSTTGRGWRLHDTWTEDGKATVREAIDAAIRAGKE